MRPALFAIVLVACSVEEEATLHPHLPVETLGNPALATDDALRDFAASGAEFGVVVDPASGETLTLRHTERTVTSSQFAPVGSAVCTDCTGCPATTRTVAMSLQRTSGSGPVDISYSSLQNFSPIATVCDGGSCPSPSVNTNDIFDIEIEGILSLPCGTFGVYFDTEDPTPPTVHPLQNATATFSQSIAGNWLASEMIDGATSANEGWAIANSIVEQTAVFETVTDTPAYGSGTEVTVTIIQTYTGNAGHLLGCYELSVTDVDRSQFADGLQVGGNVGAEAIWTALDVFEVSSTLAGQTSTITGNRVVMANHGSSNVATYTVRGDTTLTDLTGLRLVACEDPSLPLNGPGTSPVNGNFVVNELTFATRAQ